MRHIHRCATKDCPNYYVCASRDCRLDWQCPTCEDNELFSDLERLDSLTHAITQEQTHGEHSRRIS